MTNPATTTAHDRPVASPVLPPARGPLSESVLGVLAGRGTSLPEAGTIQHADPYGDDLHLLLYVLYELHYRGFAGVDGHLEWNPALLGVRAAAEDVFLDALRSDGGSGRTDVAEAVDALLLEPVGDDGRSVSHHLQREGSCGSCANTRHCAPSTTSRKPIRICGWCPGSAAGRRRRWSPSSSTNSAQAVPRTSMPSSSPI